MAYFSNELPTGPDYGTPDWDAKYDALRKVITEKLPPETNPKQQQDNPAITEEN